MAAAECPQCGGQLVVHRSLVGYDLREVKAFTEQHRVLVRMDSVVEAEMQIKAVDVYCRNLECTWHQKIPTDNVVEWL